MSEQAMEVHGQQVHVTVSGTSAAWVATLRGPDETGREVTIAKAVGTTRATALENLTALLRFRGLDYHAA